MHKPVLAAGLALLRLACFFEKSDAVSLESRNFIRYNGWGNKSSNPAAEDE